MALVLKISQLSIKKSLLVHWILIFSKSIFLWDFSSSTRKNVSSHLLWKFLIKWEAEALISRNITRVMGAHTYIIVTITLTFTYTYLNLTLTLLSDLYLHLNSLLAQLHLHLNLLKLNTYIIVRLILTLKFIIVTITLILELT